MLCLMRYSGIIKFNASDIKDCNISEIFYFYFLHNRTYIFMLRNTRALKYSTNLCLLAFLFAS